MRVKNLTKRSILLLICASIFGVLLSQVTQFFSQKEEIVSGDIVKEMDGTVSEEENGELRIFPIEQISIGSFPEYFVEPVSFVKAKEVQLKKEEHYWNHRTHYRKGFAQDADFAGKYKVVLWGCGTYCQSGGIIDLETGQIVANFVSMQGIEYSPESAIFIENPFTETDSLEGRPAIYGSAKIYLFDGDTLRFLRDQEYETRMSKR